ncbi:MAG: hypothetical protein IKI37_09505 [Oscillospiraceae bacterium]|nr:hypothetical protein [Oscillospiraceae bacterium]
MICPCCLQGEILKARIIKTSEIIKICDECDTVWKDSECISDSSGTGSKTFLSERNCRASWREFEIIGKA